MPLKPPDAILITPAHSPGASDADTSELVDTEEIYATSKEASLSEEALAAQQLAAKKLATQLRANEKKLTLDDIEEFNRRISEASSRSGSTVSEHEDASGESSRKQSLRERVFEEALKRAEKDKSDGSSEGEDEGSSKKSISTSEGTKQKELSVIKEEKPKMMKRDSGSDIEKKANLLFDQISGLKSPSSSMGTVSKVSTAEEPKHSSFAPTPTDFPEREEDYNWRTSKINISEYYLRRHAISLRRAYEETIEAIIEDQVYAVDAIKLEYLFENQFKSKKPHTKSSINKDRPKRFTIDKQLRRDTGSSNSSTSSFTRDYNKRMKLKDELRLYALLRN